MRVVVLGAGGMLGKAVAAEVKRRDHDIVECFHGDDPEKHLYDVTNEESVKLIPCGDVMINCTGMRPNCGPPEDMVKINAYAPHLIASVHDERIIHVSTDCIFSGRNGPYSVSSKASPYDFYGLTKATGEPSRHNVVVVRTSFIGFSHGFLQWLVTQKGRRVRGWARATWSGSTVYEVARGLVDIAELRSCDKLVHLCTTSPITKLDLARELNDALKLELEIEPNGHPYVDRWMVPTIPIRSTSEVLDELIHELNNGNNSSRTKSSKQKVAAGST